VDATCGILEIPVGGYCGRGGMDANAVTDVKARTDIVGLIERDLGPPAKNVGRGKALWCCPFHADKDPSFYVTSESGTYYCFGCNETGDSISWLRKVHNMSFPDAVTALGGNGSIAPAPVVIDRDARERADQDRKRAALDIMADRWPTAERYHAQMTDRSYWYSQGLSDASIDRWKLGWTPACPTYQKSASHTIPITHNGRLLSIRHRLATPSTPGDKYRPEMAGLPALMFGYDLFPGNMLLMLVEGEVKAMVLTQWGYPAIGIPGAATFKPHWVQWFKDALEVYVAFDPGAEGNAMKTCAILGDKARLVTLPVKPDDFFVRYGGTSRDFQAVLQQARQG